MKINKHVLNRALRVLGKMVCQYRWRTKSKEASTAETSIPMKAVSVVLNAHTLTVARNGVTRRIQSV